MEIVDWQVGSPKAKKLYAVHPVSGRRHAVVCGGTCRLRTGHIKLLFENWQIPGEFDCLIKTKQTDNSSKWIVAVCDFCPVLWMSKWRDSIKHGLTAGVTMTLLR